MEEFLENMRRAIETAPTADTARFLRAALADLEGKYMASAQATEEPVA